jgi:hypothetical protein
MDLAGQARFFQMLEHSDAHAALNGLIAAHHQEPIDHRFLVVTYNLAVGERHFALVLVKRETCERNVPEIIGTLQPNRSALTKNCVSQWWRRLAAAGT